VIRWLVLLGGGIWEIVRFAAVYLTVVTLPSELPYAHINLLWFGSPAVVLAALFFSAAYHPDRARFFVPILRIGLAVSVIADAAAIVTGSFNGRLLLNGMPDAAGDRFVFVMTFVVLVVDLLLASALLWYRPRREDVSVTESDLPDYDSTTVDE
jgi:hypothetical protein